MILPPKNGLPRRNNCAAAQPPVPLGGISVEDVEIDLAGHAVGEAGAGILPEDPFLARIDLAGMFGDGAEPERVV